MEHKAFACPFCGAPFREAIPLGVTQVKCGYCGGMVLVSPRLKGLVRRCSNHPETLAIGLCNDCGGSYCDHCLRILNAEHGLDIYVCPACLEKRRNRSIQALIILGFIDLFLGFLLMSVSLMWGVIFVLLFSLPLISVGVGAYYAVQLREKPTVHERMEERVKLPSTPENLYEKMLDTYIGAYGSGIGEMLLEKKINACINLGLNREEAIRKVARDEGYGV